MRIYTPKTFHNQGIMKRSPLPEVKEVTSFLNKDSKVNYYLQILKDPFFIKDDYNPLTVYVSSLFDFRELFSKAINDNKFLTETKEYSIHQYNHEIIILLNRFLIEFYLLNNKIIKWSDSSYSLSMQDKKLFIIDTKNNILEFSEAKLKKWNIQRILQLQMEITFFFKQDVQNIINRINHTISNYPF